MRPKWSFNEPDRFGSYTFNVQFIFVHFFVQWYCHRTGFF